MGSVDSANHAFLGTPSAKFCDFDFWPSLSYSAELSNGERTENSLFSKIETVEAEVTFIHPFV